MISKKNTGTAHENLKILIINPFGIGDVLFATPVINNIKLQYPESFIGYWSNLRVAPVLADNPEINRIYSGNRGDFKKAYQESFFKGLRQSFELLRSIRKEKFDICLDFSLDHRYSLFAKLIGIKKRIGFNYKGRGRFLTDKVELSGYQGRHVIEYYLDLLKFLGIDTEDKRMHLAVPPSGLLKAENMLASYGVEKNDIVIAIAPGAGGSWGKNAAYKHWPALKFAQVADLLISKFRAKVLVLGDESERGIADIIVCSMVNKPIDLVGKTDLAILPGIIKSCNLLVTNDGGPMHIAVTLGVKSVSIFGPVSEIAYGPFPASSKNLVISSDMPCRPCYKNFRLPVCDNDRQCLKSVEVDKVFQACLKLLN